MKEKIKSLFINDKKTPFEISEMLQINEKEVRNILRDFGFNKISERKFYLLKAQPFTKLHKEFIYGCLLGNGKLKKAGKKSSHSLHIEEIDKETILWKKQNLAKYVNVINNDGYLWSFNTISHDELNIIHKLFYNNNKKVLSDKIVQIISPLSMAVFFIDRGQLQLMQTLKFKTYDYSLEDNKIIQILFKLICGVNSKICTYKRNNKEYYYISVNKRNTLIFMNLIRSYLNESSTTRC